jgi:ribosomal protein L16 Arg81 hydroxylase
MDIDSPLTLLGGLTPAQFMRRHWQTQAAAGAQRRPGMQPLLTAPALFELAGREGVESRLVSLATRLAAAARPVHAPLVARRRAGRAGRCWCRAWTCTTRRPRAAAAVRFVPPRGWTT